MFKKKPFCEVCGEKEAISFSDMSRGVPGSKPDWKFVCECTADTEGYYIMIDSFFSSPSATVDWLAHMEEKSGMDWGNFMEMMHRFRKATDSFSSM